MKESDDDTHQEFIDPSADELEILKHEITKCPTVGKIIEMCETVYPKWIVCFLDRFCQDYPHLQHQEHQDPKQEGKEDNGLRIMIVDAVPKSPKHTFIRLLADVFTYAGVFVRTKDEFQPCTKCLAAIPTPQYYEKMRDRKVPDLPSWKPRCRACE